MTEVENLNAAERPQLNIPDVSSSAVYPLAFLTRANKLFMKSKTELSADGTPRYIPNPNARATYCLQDCMKDYTPIYDKNQIEYYPYCGKSSCNGSCY